MKQPFTFVSRIVLEAFALLIGGVGCSCDRHPESLHFEDAQVSPGAIVVAIVGDGLDVCFVGQLFDRVNELLMLFVMGSSGLIVFA